MNQLSLELLQELLFNDMTYEEYEFPKLFVIYLSIMNSRPYKGKFQVMGKDSLRRRFNEWSATKGGWVIKNSKRVKIIYYKRAFHRCETSRPEAIRRVRKKLRGLVPWPK